jgi:hypothetical protein
MFNEVRIFDFRGLKGIDKLFEIRQFNLLFSMRLVRLRMELDRLRFMMGMGGLHKEANYKINKEFELRGRQL